MKMNKIINYKNFDKQNKKMPLHILMDEISLFPPLYGKSLNVFNGFFYIHWDKYSFWFRFFGGYGLHGKSLKDPSPKLFSERNGYEKYTTFLGWKFRILKPNNN